MKSVALWVASLMMDCDWTVAQDWAKGIVHPQIPRVLSAKMCLTRKSPQFCAFLAVFNDRGFCFPDFLELFVLAIRNVGLSLYIYTYIYTHTLICVCVCVCCARAE